jgi:hypothetical protein
MGFRFRKGVRIAPGLRLNITKHGISSLSVGGRGLTFNLGKKGTRSTAGIPGSGLSYSHYSSYEEKSVPEQIDRETGEITPATTRGGMPWGLIALIAVIVLGVYMLRTVA